MKTTATPMKSVFIILIGALAFGLSFFACDPKSEKINAFNDIISTSTFQDTAITYSLSSDSLILEFAKEPKMKHWYGEIYLVKFNPYKEIIIPFPDKAPENMGQLRIKKGKFTFSGFHIPADSLSQYIVRLHVTPYIPGFMSRGEIYAEMYLFSSKQNGSNKLEVSDQVHDFKITSFDLVKLKNMSPDLRDFCRDSIEKAFFTTFTDVEIEESKYGF